MILHGDCLERLRELDAGSVDAVVCDPPYGLAFMGKRWDYEVPSVEVWREVLRVLKPGGHALIACGTRTQHRMVVNIEDAGFEIRDVVTWLYGQGFPKSLDISKAIDKAAGAEREQTGVNRPENRVAYGKGVGALRCLSCGNSRNGMSCDCPLPSAVTAAAKQWQGFGTALKPACEFWTLARKPLEGTVAMNVMKHGTGGLNIDGCRVQHASAEDLAASQAKNPGRTEGVTSGVYGADRPQQVVNTMGRFPANLILDEEAAAALDEQSGRTRPGHIPRTGKTVSMFGPNNHAGGEANNAYGDSGGASRFFLRVGYGKDDACGFERTRGGDTSAGRKTESRSESLNTDGCGSRRTDQFLMGTMSITEMGTHSIINFPILSASTRTFIGTITIETGKTIELSLAENLVGVSVASATEACLHFRDGQQETITGIVSLASESTALAGVIETVNTGTRTIGSIAGSRFLYVAKVSASERNAGCEDIAPRRRSDARPNSGDMTGKFPDHDHRERKGNFHPTVKPIKLMRYLCRLVTPPGGQILDPFAGSGSTGVAAILEGFRFVGIEREAEYVAIAEKRLQAARFEAMIEAQEAAAPPLQPTLFDEVTP